MTDKDVYFSVEKRSEGLYKEKGSRFISYVFPVSSQEEVKEHVDALKKEHHSARHCCFAWRLGNEGNLFRANDDGEPSGSAGKPILAAMDSEGVSDTLVVVVRYFGGILLGAAGLVRAYRTSAMDALGKAGRRQKTVTRQFELSFGYGQQQTALGIVRGIEGTGILGQEFDMECRITVAVPQSESVNFERTVKKINDEKGTCIQCRPLQTAPERN